MGNPFDKDPKVPATPLSLAAEHPTGVVEELDVNECVQRLRRLFSRMTDVGHKNLHLDEEFSASEYATGQLLLDTGNNAALGFTGRELAGEKAKQLRANYAEVVRKELNLLVVKGFLELLDNGKYRLTSNGRGVVGPRH